MYQLIKKDSIFKLIILKVHSNKNGERIKHEKCIRGSAATTCHWRPQLGSGGTAQFRPGSHPLWRNVDAFENRLLSGRCLSYLCRCSLIDENRIKVFCKVLARAQATGARFLFTPQR